MSYDQEKVAAAIEQQCTSKGAVVYKMPALEDIPDEAKDFGMELAENGVLFLPNSKVLFICKDKHGTKLLMFVGLNDSSGDSIIGVATEVGREFSRTTVFGLQKVDGKIGVCRVANLKAPDSADEKLHMMSSGLYWFLGLLSSGMASVSNIPAPERLNKKRERNGKSPITEHNVVTVRKVGGSHAPGSGDRRQVRLHWRRGHVRKMQNGTIAIVRPHLVGTRELGEVIHDAYDCRHMINYFKSEATIH